MSFLEYLIGMSITSIREVQETLLILFCLLLYRQDIVLNDFEDNQQIFKTSPLKLSDHWKLIANINDNKQTDLLCAIVYDATNGRLLSKISLTTKKNKNLKL